MYGNRENGIEILWGKYRDLYGDVPDYPPSNTYDIDEEFPANVSSNLDSSSDDSSDAVNLMSESSREPSPVPQGSALGQTASERQRSPQRAQRSPSNSAVANLLSGNYSGLGQGPSHADMTAPKVRVARVDTRWCRAPRHFSHPACPCMRHCAAVFNSTATRRDRRGVIATESCPEPNEVVLE